MANTSQKSGNRPKDTAAFLEEFEELRGRKNSVTRDERERRRHRCDTLHHQISSASLVEVQPAGTTQDGDRRFHLFVQGHAGHMDNTISGFCVLRHSDGRLNSCTNGETEPTTPEQQVQRWADRMDEAAIRRRGALGWRYDNNNNLVGMVQLPPDFQLIEIPRSCCRTKNRKGNRRQVSKTLQAVVLQRRIGNQESASSVTSQASR